MREFGKYGFARGSLSNEDLYRDWLRFFIVVAPQLVARTLQNLETT